MLVEMTQCRSQFVCSKGSHMTITTSTSTGGEVFVAVTSCSAQHVPVLVQWNLFTFDSGEAAIDLHLKDSWNRSLARSLLAFSESDFDGSEPHGTRLVIDLINVWGSRTRGASWVHQAGITTVSQWCHIGVTRVSADFVRFPCSYSLVFYVWHRLKGFLGLQCPCVAASRNRKGQWQFSLL